MEEPLKSLSLDYLNLLINGQAFSDVAFSVEGRLVHAHRCVLAARSPFFRKFFSYGGGGAGDAAPPSPRRPSSTPSAAPSPPSLLLLPPPLFLLSRASPRGHRRQRRQLRGVPPRPAVPLQRPGLARPAAARAPQRLRRPRLLARPLHCRRRPRPRHPRRRPLLRHRSARPPHPGL
uniref:BTB domain-containing protein n=1 Tax=Ananas comosus var. bracteatus TaxID=296719 RepID=A0A6V7PRW3_ANACO|nr:unnamed protein product [Ananas comosus var. bracteatus]